MLSPSVVAGIRSDGGEGSRCARPNSGSRVRGTAERSAQTARTRRSNSSAFTCQRPMAHRSRHTAGILRSAAASTAPRSVDSTAVFVASTLPMLVKAGRTKNLASYSLGNIVLANVGKSDLCHLCCQPAARPGLGVTRLPPRCNRPDAVLVCTPQRSAPTAHDCPSQATYPPRG